MLSPNLQVVPVQHRAHAGDCIDEHREEGRERDDLATAIQEYVSVHNKNPKPFIWTAKAADILQKVIRANSQLSSKQNEALH